MAVGRVTYNETTDAGVSSTVASANASRQRLFFKAVGGDMTLNFGAPATATSILKVPQGASVSIDNRDPYDIRQEINVYAAGAYWFECQAEEMSV